MNCLETIISFLRGGIWSSLEKFLLGLAHNNFPLLGALKLTSQKLVPPTSATNEVPTRSLTRPTTSYDIYFKPNYSALVKYPSYRLPISILLMLGTLSVLILAAKRRSIDIKHKRFKKKHGNRITANRKNYDLLDEKLYNFFNPGKSSRINSLSGYCWNVGPKVSSCQADIEETIDTKLDSTINQYCHSVDYNRCESPTSFMVELQRRNISVKEYLELILEESEDEENGPENAFSQCCIDTSKLNRIELESKAKTEIELICSNDNEAEVLRAVKVFRILMSYDSVGALEDNNTISMSETYLNELKAALPAILQFPTRGTYHNLPIVLLLKDYFLYCKNRDIEVRQFLDCILFFFEFLKRCDNPSDKKSASRALLQVLIAIEEDMFNVAIPIICKSLKTEKSENYHCFIPILVSLKIVLAISEKAESRVLALKSIRTIIQRIIGTGQNLDSEFLSELNEVFWVCQNVDYVDQEVKLRPILSDITVALEYIKSKTSEKRN